MEEMAKAPVNQAHLLDQQAQSLERKADALSAKTKKPLLERAIECRERAIDCLMLAQSPLLTDECKSSLEMQISSHRAKIHILREQQHEEDSKLPLTPKIEIIPENPRTNLLRRRSSLVPPAVLHHPTQTDIELAIKNEILKGDKLLESLVSQQSKEASPTPLDFHNRRNDLMISSAIKLPKPVEEVLEELQCHNLQLKSLIGTLFEELEALKGENLKLKQRVTELEHGKDTVDNEGGKQLQSNKTAGTGIIELPPLEPFEMPQIPNSIKPRVKVPPRKSYTSE